MSEESKRGDGYVPDAGTRRHIRQLQLEHTTIRIEMGLQYGVLVLALVLIVVLSLCGKLDATVSALLATLLGYVLRSTQAKK